MAIFTHLLSGLAQRGFLFVLKLFKENSQELFIFSVKVHYISPTYLFCSLTWLPWCCNNLWPPGSCSISAFSLPLDFHDTWCNRSILNIHNIIILFPQVYLKKFLIITNNSGCHTYCSQSVPAAGPGRTNTAWASPSSHTYAASLQQCQTGSAAEVSAAAV